MTLTLTPINILDGAGASKPVVSYNDGTNNVVAHVLLDNTGALISPATAANQAAANTSLATIATNAALSATAAKQDTGNTALATIATNTTGLATAAAQATAATSLATIAGNGASVPGVIPLTVGTTATAGRSFAVNCTVAGNVAVTFSDASISTYPVNVGLTVFPFSVTKVNTTGTTATATYENWK